MPARTATDSPAGGVAGADAAPIDVCVDGRPVLRLVPLDGRVRVGLTVPGLDRVVDISVQPIAACRSLEDAGRRARVPASAVEADARSAVTEAATRSGGWMPGGQVDLLTAFSGVAFPLLGAAHDAGTPPVPDVPRWAEPMLGAATVADGAAIAFGARSTRPVRRALVETLRPQPDAREAGLGVIALALTGCDVLEPDRLARLLRAERADHPSADWPEPSAFVVPDERSAGGVRFERSASCSRRRREPMGCGGCSTRSTTRCSSGITALRTRCRTGWTSCTTCIGC